MAGGFCSAVEDVECRKDDNIHRNTQICSPEVPFLSAGAVSLDHPTHSPRALVCFEVSLLGNYEPNLAQTLKSRDKFVILNFQPLCKRWLLLFSCTCLVRIQRVDR